MNLSNLPDFNGMRVTLIRIYSNTMSRTGNKRWAAFGQTDGGRFLTIIFTRREKLLRIISARDMNRKERKFYEKNG